MALSAITLTATTASQANSAETAGLRIDGKDALSQATYRGKAVNLCAKANKAWYRWNWTPRHSAANLVKFNAAPVIFVANGDANNRITVDATAANTVRLTAIVAGASTTANWDCTAAVVAGTTYKMEAKFKAGTCQLIVDGAVKASVAVAGVFATIPATLYWGADVSAANQVDAVYGPI